MNLRSSEQLASRIASAYIAKVQGEQGDKLCKLAVTPSYAFCLELSLSGNGVWSFDDMAIEFVETVGSGFQPDASDRRLGIAGYMPETALLKPSDPIRSIDALVELWGVPLPHMDKALGEQDRCAPFERFKALIADNPDLQATIQDALLDRVDKEFRDELLRSVHHWLKSGHEALGESLLDK